MSGGKNWVRMHLCAGEIATDSAPRGCDGKVTERKKETGDVKSKTLQRTINQFKKISISPREQDF